MCVHTESAKMGKREDFLDKTPSQFIKSHQVQDADPQYQYL